MNGLLLREDIKLELNFAFHGENSENADENADWEKISTEPLIYAGSGCLLEITCLDEMDYFIYKFKLTRKNGDIIPLDTYSVSCVTPCIDTYNVSPRFTGYIHINHHNPPEIISTATTKEYPYAMYSDKAGINRISVGLANQLIETSITRQANCGHVYYDSNRIAFKRPIRGVKLRKTVIEDAVFVSLAEKPWFFVNKDYWAFIDRERGYTPNPIPESALGPVWCSWLYGLDIDEDKIWQNALAAKELGIKTLIIDAGWYTHDTDVPFDQSLMKNDSFGFGRVEAALEKFPDMRGLVEKIHNLGLYVWAWVAPRWVFKPVEEGLDAVDRELLDLRIRTSDGEVVPMLCTRTLGAREHAAQFTAYVMEKYFFDGLKFDSWELDWGMEACTAGHEHVCDTMGEGTAAWAESIYKAMTAVKPDAVVWFNNTTMKPYSNYSCSPNEIYCQPDENWRMAVVLKTFTTGIAAHLSEGAFHRDEPDWSVAYHLAILMMGHTPELQVDLTALSPSHKKIIKNFFNFYDKHRESLQYGDFTPFGFEHMRGGPISTLPPHVRIDAGEELFLFIGEVRLDTIPITQNVKTIFIFNLQNSPKMNLRLDGIRQCGALVYDEFLEPKAGFDICGADGMLELNADVIPGGMVELAVHVNTGQYNHF